MGQESMLRMGDENVRCRAALYFRDAQTSTSARVYHDMRTDWSLHSGLLTYDISVPPVCNARVCLMVTKEI